MNYNQTLIVPRVGVLNTGSRASLALKSTLAREAESS
ncbi:hypothetical protein SGGMMB4_02767 [Sodalis glossinidius str. 'morsitans']|uniref:Uncharacterized protein n=1 Tax=Sodalis glossinidius (strain morsitans) TaxID=343509 RepID=A0A193QJU9_SODGM|nr:hypothetical protein SGGMMB4_02767 [Sodalis glossinidius str. 'morsitans']